MKRLVTDDVAVKAICERLGCWESISKSRANRQSGVLSVGCWVIGYYLDGLVASEFDSPVEAGLWAVLAASQTLRGGLRGFGFESYQKPATH